MARDGRTKLRSGGRSPLCIVYGTQERRRRYVQGGGEPAQAIDADIALTVLEIADIGSVNAAQGGHIVLREASGDPGLPQVRCEIMAFYGRPHKTNFMVATSVLARPCRAHFCRLQAMDTLAKRLRYARERAGFSQSELARRVKLRPQAIQFIEAGHVRRPRTLVEIARALAVNPAWLLLGEGAVEVGVREAQSSYQGEPALSEEAVVVARLWMGLPKGQRLALKEVLLALLKTRS